MGYITNITIRNDALGYIKDNPKEVIEKIVNAIGSGVTQTIPIGPYCNYVTVHKTRHMSENSVYVQYSNCVMEVSPYSKDYLEMLRKNPKFAKEILDYLNKVVKNVESLFEANEE